MGFFDGLFGPGRDHTWRILADHLGGRFAEGGFFEGPHVAYRHGHWTIVLDQYTRTESSGFDDNKTERTVTHTRLRAPVANPSGLRFKVYRTHPFSSLGAWLGFQDIVVGHPRFDNQWVIKGNNEALVRALFDEAELRRLLGFQPDGCFKLIDDEALIFKVCPAGVDELIWDVEDDIRDIPRLESLFRLVAVTLNRLHAIGAVNHVDTGVQLT